MKTPVAVSLLLSLLPLITLATPAFLSQAPGLYFPLTTEALQPKASLTFPQYPRRIMSYRGGATDNNSKTPSNNSIRHHVTRNLFGLWGVSQVVLILFNAIKRLFPIAIQPLQRNDLFPYQWVLYIIWSLGMIYTEGYKAFQLKFAPLVVSRAFGLSENANILNIIFAGPYSMGMFAADNKRIIVSWAVTIGVFSLVTIVKSLPYPYRSIVDAGVVGGLSYGTLSILVQTIRALLGFKVGGCK